MTWLKGLRQNRDLFDTQAWCTFLPCDLIEGITTILNRVHRFPLNAYFYLVTWMKGLRLNVKAWLIFFCICIFTLWPEWRDYDLNNSLYEVHFSLLIFTLWPEWRDYDLRGPVARFSEKNTRFLPCDLNEGITTTSCEVVTRATSPHFYLVTWMKGLRPGLEINTSGKEE